MTEQSTRKRHRVTDDRESERIVMTVEQACKELSLSEPTMRRRAADDPNFPRKIKLSVRRVGFVREEVEAYIARQREAASAAA